MSKYGSRIQFFRKRAGLSRRVIARRLDVSVQSVASWESGASNPSMARIEAVLAALECTAAEFFATAN